MHLSYCQERSKYCVNILLGSLWVIASVE